MSQHFKLLNCISPKQARGKNVKPWVMNCFVKDIERTCIIDTGCNVSAKPLSLIQRLDLKLIPAPRMTVTIADGSSYTPIGMVDINITVCNLSTQIRALVSSGDQILLGLDWMERAGCILDIPRRQLTMSPLGGDGIVVHLQHITSKAGTSSLQLGGVSPSAQPVMATYKWINFMTFKNRDNELYIWDIPVVSKGGHKPRLAHQQFFLLRTDCDIIIPPFTQYIHASKLAVACPQGHYIEVQPWQHLTKTRRCLVAHGFYDRNYRGSFSVLLANVSTVSLTIHKDQVLARIQAVRQDLVGDITMVEGADLGIETPVAVYLCTNVTIEELDQESISVTDQN
jgi:dUTPase